MKLYLCALCIGSALFAWVVWILYSNIQLQMGIVEQILRRS